VNSQQLIKQKFILLDSINSKEVIFQVDGSYKYKLMDNPLGPGLHFAIKKLHLVANLSTSNGNYVKKIFDSKDKKTNLLYGTGSLGQHIFRVINNISIGNYLMDVEVIGSIEPDELQINFYLNPGQVREKF
jgi:hypothetical protein